ncbi:beta-mannanase [Paenibacillus sp. 481]|uniref:beta-mannanase n=1 Tax=Paenibacillus sp. 481 TaxID=2835869 RepID=UPI001E50D487|nr:beta-mannanase [Paenibacillus sp. 481]UHA75105.1 beta-mannanase [Paenibacillus sp. 481]
MQFIEADSTSPVISDCVHQIDDDRCTLRWRWPDGVQAVFIHKADADAVRSEPTSASQMKLYTKDEYKANNGYHDRIEGIGRYVYTIYACANSATIADTVLIRQQHGENQLLVSTGKAKIYFSIRHKSSLFRKYKTVQIEVKAEVPFSKDVLCYVKKQGGSPLNKEDGTMYPFVGDFAAGRNVLPVIEVGKDDYVRLFFTDGRRYGHMYELVPE